MLSATEPQLMTVPRWPSSYCSTTGRTSYEGPSSDLAALYVSQILTGSGGNSVPEKTGLFQGDGDRVTFRSKRALAPVAAHPQWLHDARVQMTVQCAPPI